MVRFLVDSQINKGTSSKQMNFQTLVLVGWPCDRMPLMKQNIGTTTIDPVMYRLFKAASERFESHVFESLAAPRMMYRRR
mmetsp:Transcript_95845/g.170125  ORF Transcript_95845/g.170125 Transcript_95845/m.170125 type:complete len:80 (+) Transcript_95845:169-408(+)